MRQTIGFLGALTLAFGVGCVEDRHVDGPRLAIGVAALELDDVEDAIWDLRVTTSTGAVVFSTRITSGQYGDGAGSTTYVGPCDASAPPFAGTDANATVEVTLIGLYPTALAAADVGAFTGDAQDLGGAPTPLPFENPGTLTRRAVCRANADTAVRFDVSVLRPAGQGFVDLAVNFNDVFCSAKYDCGAAGAPLELLFDANGVRRPTHVLAFACTGGVGAGATTNLYLDDITVACPGDDPPLTLALPQAGAQDGNQRDLSQVASYEYGAAGNDRVFQWAVFSGDEQLAGLNKRYYNVAIGFDALPAGCQLATRGTADSSTAPLGGGAIAPGDVYPYIVWDVPLTGCEGSFELTYGEGGAVRTEYTAIDRAEALVFDRDLFGAAPVDDGPTCSPSCDNGGACVATDTCVCVGPFTGPGCATLDGFSLLPAGTFTMGSPDGVSEYPIGSGQVPPAELGRLADREAPVEVTLTRAFYMQQTPVTQGEWEAVQQWLVGQGLQATAVTNPSFFPACGDDCPVETLSWWSALAYANALSASQGLPPCYTLPTTRPDGAACAGTWQAGTLDCGDQLPAVNSATANVYDCAGYRLATEAEWEYAARAGTTTATYNGDLTTTGCADPVLTPIAWYCANNGALGAAVGTKPVGLKSPNAWGLYDMLGNVFEFGWDRYDLDALDLLGGTDPQQLASGAVRVVRGASWSNDAGLLRSARRGANNLGNSAVGFRIVVTATP